MPSAQPRTSQRRSDAESNRQKILSAGRAALADSDTEVSMAEIARRAGVGMATLYRNFPGRLQLLEALYADEVDVVCASAATVEGASDGERFTAWLREFFAFVASKRHVASELLQHTDESNPVFGRGRAKVAMAGLPLLAAAARAGDVRSDLSLDQILDLVHSVASIPADYEYVGPILDTVMAGLSAPR
jgi:AcrR family transcriptional regulator